MRYAEASLSGEGGSSRREPVISNSLLGVIIFILTEMMFFIGLISAYSISKANALEWPPLDQPRLPIGATAFNTVALLASGVAMFLTSKTFAREGFSRKSEQLFLFALGLGLFFVVFQGFEWARLLGFGLTMQSSTYGAFFYLIIGTHAVHAIGALFALGRLFFKMRNRTLRLASLHGGQAFWYFVVGVWPILYVLVYLN
ncbi:cytochrome c oxidase subunit 3 [Pelagicoccus sp. SDUM812003]|uniref:cytochrome c oxidase subunit 3 n=1 Tax=Pelagicoccus sp. SDUM812003 TaxID=3041267 RepID=UPI00280FE0C0|nr:cytochrome c oxidase subunit 3 [Pelagicoccus sp. SDUM812003]MDQ8204941.1 cytochrome c oxidase subunit 3 [Pelagicoccus sp. SDUM812003]